MQPTVEDPKAGRTAPASPTIAEGEKRPVAASLAGDPQLPGEAGPPSDLDRLLRRGHEIRTPMNGVIGMTSLLLDTALSDEQREYVHIIRSSGKALLAVVDDMLDYSSLAAGELALSERPFSLRAMLSESLRIFSLQAQEKGLELVLRVPPEVPDGLIGDPRRLGQILHNLVGNALKFTEAGEVRVEAAVVEVSEDRARLRLSVLDTGPGLPAEKLARLLDADMTAAPAQPQPGPQPDAAGLGLQVCAALAGLMRGRIDAESQLGKGSRFSLLAEFGLLATAWEPSQCIAASAPGMLSGTAAFLAIANAATRDAVEEMLEAWGMRSIRSGSAALAELLDLAAGPGLPQLLMIDLAGGDDESFDLAANIRAEAALADLPLILFTRCLHRGDAARCRALGVSGYLCKPLAWAEVAHALRVALALASPASAAGQQRRLVGRPPSLDILLAEDNPVNSLLAARVLEMRGHRVSSVKNGREALRACERQRFDLILMDLQMPEMDGAAATAEIRRRESGGRRTPIVALTAESLQAARARCLAAGMDEVLSKPIEPTLLMETVQRLAGQGDKRDRARERRKAAG